MYFQIVSTAAKLSAKRRFWIIATLFSTMGLAWIPGFLMLFSMDPTYSLAMSWIFAIFATTQVRFWTIMFPSCSPVWRTWWTYKCLFDIRQDSIRSDPFCLSDPFSLKVLLLLSNSHLWLCNIFLYSLKPSKQYYAGPMQTLRGHPVWALYRFGRRAAMAPHEFTARVSCRSSCLCSLFLF